MSESAQTPTRVDVIVVNYKSAGLTIDAVHSLESDRNLPELSLRVVVVENASGDARALREGLAGMDHVHLIEAPRNGGFSYGNNLGFKHCFESEQPPEYFMLLNPDTRAEPGAIAELCRFLRETPKAGICGSSLQNGDGSEWPIAFRFPTLLSEVEQGVCWGPVTKLLRPWVVAKTMGKQPEKVDWLPGAAMMIRASLIRELGGMDENYFLYYEETDFCLKAARAGFESWYVPQSRVMHISGQSTGVTGAGEDERRYPAYWFESRRRYFTKNYGVRYAALTDLVYLASAGLGYVKSMVQRRRKHAPLFAYDVIRHSPCFPANRQCDDESAYRAPL